MPVGYLPGKAGVSGMEPASKDVNTIAAKPFSQMTGMEKMKHVGKVIVFLLSFGFIFPNILSE
jgi:hypothetical protein